MPVATWSIHRARPTGERSCTSHEDSQKALAAAKAAFAAHGLDISEPLAPKTPDDPALAGWKLPEGADAVWTDGTHAVARVPGKHANRAFSPVLLR